MIKLIGQQIAALQRTLDRLSESLDGFADLDAVPASEISAARGQMLLRVEKLYSSKLQGVRRPFSATDKT